MVALRRALSLCTIPALLAAAMAAGLGGPPAEAARMPPPSTLGSPTLTDPGLADPNAMPAPFDNPEALQQNLSRRLNRASRDRSERARRALMSNPATRGLLEGPRPTRQTFDFAACRVDPTPDCLLDEAVATALYPRFPRYSQAKKLKKPSDSPSMTGILRGESRFGVYVWPSHPDSSMNCVPAPALPT